MHISIRYSRRLGATPAAVLALFGLCATLLPVGLSAQRAPSADRPAYDPALYQDGSRTNRAFKSLEWRNVGPSRGGRSTAVTGDPTNPLVFYFGAVNGGVWKTSNAGQSWENITDGVSDISSVGAIAVAPSDPNVIWVGTGEGEPREDLTYGTGVYRSTDGGRTWMPRGLANTHQITTLRVHPTNPDIAFVGALGHAFGPSPDRGVYRTRDGGASWTRVLFLNDSAGAGRSGLWKSTDGGDSWTELTFNPGMPRGLIGKIGVSVSPANSQRVYANIEAQDSLGGVFRSDDGGDHWTRTSGDQRFVVRPYYYTKVTADPKNENTLYLMNLSVHRSIDGGSTFSTIRVPHGDTHIMWVDPANPDRMINGNDGGASISLDGGRTWSSQDNQPTAQFYHVTTDHQVPYRIYGGQQDNSTVSIASRSDNGSIDERDWFPVAGCESAYIAIDPRNADITYGGCYMGALSRHDQRTKSTRDVSVWLRNYDGMGAIDVPQRFQWTFPVHFSPHDSSALYVTSQYVWRSRTEGASWEKISPDLTVADSATLGRSGGPVTGDMTGTEWYASIFAFAESPVRAGVLWAGSDDGLVHVSTDNGANWRNVTPPTLGAFTRVSIIEPSPFDAGTAYVAANRYQQDDFAPYLYKTTDYGATWTRIDAGIPMGAYTRAIRSDIKRQGLLFAGTETGVYVSFNDGARWEPLQLNLPRVSVRDVRVHDNDVIVATHGRAFWALDDISPLRTLSDSITNANVFAPAPAVRWVSRGGGDGTRPGANPRFGVSVDYWLKEPPTGTVTLQFLHADGTVIRSFRSARDRAPDSTGSAAGDSAAAAARERLEEEQLSYSADTTVLTRAGSNRFVWDLQYPNAKRIPRSISDLGTFAGPMAIPGDYTVRLIVAGDTLTRPFTVVPDPRVTLSNAEYVAQFRLRAQVVDRISSITDAVARIEDLKSQLAVRARQTDSQPYADSVKQASTPLSTQLEAVRADVYEVYTKADQATLHFPVKLYQQFITLNAQVGQGTHPPTQQHGEIYTELSGKLDAQLARLRTLEDVDLRAFNALLDRLGIPGVFVAPPKPIG